MVLFQTLPDIIAPTESNCEGQEGKHRDLVELIQDLQLQLSNNLTDLAIREAFLQKTTEYFIHKAECFICKFPDLVVETLILFATDTTADYSLYLQKLSFCLAACNKCLKVFYEKQFDCIAKYESETQLDIYSSLTRWSVDRLVERFAENVADQNESRWFTFLLEILMNPILIFSNEHLHDSFVSFVSGTVSEFKVPLLKDLFVGEFLLFFHSNMAIRKWALGSVCNCTDKKPKGFSRRSLEFIAQCMKRLLISGLDLPHFMTDSTGKFKSFCYFLLYGFGVESLHFRDVLPFNDWIGWFCPEACNLLVREPANSKIIFRGFISCFNTEFESIVQGNYVDSILQILKIGRQPSLGQDAEEKLLSFDTLKTDMDHIFYPTIIRFFQRAVKLNSKETQDKILGFIYQLIKEFSLDSTIQLRILFYGCMKDTDFSFFVTHFSEINDFFLADLTRFSSTNPLNMAAGQLFYDLYKTHFHFNIYNAIFDSLFLQKSPSQLAPIVHFLLWMEFGQYFVNFVNNSNDAVFIRYAKYFSLIASSLPELPIDEYLTEYKFVFSLILLLNSPFEIIRSVVVKTCIKKLGFIAQNFIYSNATSLILDSVLDLGSIHFKNQPDFGARLCEFLNAFYKSINWSKCNLLIKGCINFWIFFNLINCSNEIRLIETSLEIVCCLFTTLLEFSKEIYIQQFFVFIGIEKEQYLEFKLDNCQQYFPNLMNLLKNEQLKEKTGILIGLLCKMWLRLNIQLSNTTISHVKILVTSSESLSSATIKNIRSFIEEYDAKSRSNVKFSLSPMTTPVLDFTRATSTDSIPVTVGKGNSVQSPPSLSNRKSITLDDLSEFGRKAQNGSKHVVDLTRIDSAPKKLHSNYSVQLNQMKDISKEFVLRMPDKPSSALSVEILPNLTQPYRSIKLLDTSAEFQDPLLKSSQSAYQQNTKKRLYCDLSPLFRSILGWNHAKLDEEKIPFNAANKSKKVFASFSEYEETFEPLLLMEAKEQISRSMEESDHSTFQICIIISVSHTNEFTDLIFDCTFEAVRTFSENDYTIISDEKGNSFAAFITEIIPKFGHSELKVRTMFTRATRALVPELREGTEWKIETVCNLITIIREYQALKGLAYVPVKDFILSPFFNPVPKEDLDKKVRSLQPLLGLNHSQAVAVAAAIENSATPFTLIQGPPGTGKTKTIQSIIGLILRPRELAASHPSGKGRRRRQILLCAPSNAAVDELVRRIHFNGLIAETGEVFFPKMIRFGTIENIHEDIKDVTLDVLTEKSIGKRAIEQCDQLREQVKQLESNMRSSSTDALDEVHSREAKQLLQSKRNELRGAIKKLDETKQNLRSKFLSESDIICCTLSGSGHDSLAKLDPFFDTVIIDEACQCVETSSLIPMKYKCRSCILVGDPNQLPPTILSSKAAKCSFETSLFQRVQSVAPESVFLLSVQYRMHPDIAYFPSKYFYSDKLQNGPHVGTHPDFKLDSVPTKYEPLSKAYAFFNIVGKEEAGQLKSYKNPTEVEAVISLVKLLCTLFSRVNFYGRIGIITPYKQQQYELRRRFIQEFGKDVTKAVDINTVDAFQGQEKDIIIFSCVRAGTSVGFLADTRRLNVALTRAKSKVFIVGNSPRLIKNVLWENLISDAKARKSFFDLNITELAKNLVVNPSVSFLEPKPLTKDKTKISASELNQLHKFVIAKPTSRLP